MANYNNSIEKANENCWQNGFYNSNCNCATCIHKYECAGDDSADERADREEDD